MTTSEPECATWGSPRFYHPDCIVVVQTATDDASCAVRGPVPRVCMCECTTCKRAWEAMGRPMLKDGKIVRRTDP